MNLLTGAFSALMLLAVQAMAAEPPNSMVHQSGRAIVDGRGQPLKLRGVNLGGWLLWEGWIFGDGFSSQTAIEKKLSKLVGPDEVNRLRAEICDGYITEADIARISALGFNCVRVPMRWRLLQNGQWPVLDRLIDNCAKHGVYAVLDLHSAPGGQSDWFTCDPENGRGELWSSPEDQQLTVSLWKEIAQRYRDRTAVAGYDLINEPSAPGGPALTDLYQRIITAIRSVDTNHLIILEGNKLATDFSIFPHPLTANQAYSFHIYNWFGDDRKRRLAQYRALSVSQDVPIWCGEFGENNYAMIHSTAQMFDAPENGVSGWTFWTWKRAPAGHPGLVTVTLPADWQQVIRWAGSPLRRAPSREQALEGFKEFLTAVRLDNCQLDNRMAEALKPK